MSSKLFFQQRRAVVPVSRNEHGTFYDGDSYIIYKASEEGQEAGDVDEVIHYWLGAHSSTDEQGIAAFKATELKELLGSSPRLWRDEQGKETAEFKGHFGTSMR
jgi:gelsolin